MWPTDLLVSMARRDGAAAPTRHPTPRVAPAAPGNLTSPQGRVTWGAARYGEFRERGSLVRGPVPGRRWSASAKLQLTRVGWGVGKRGGGGARYIAASVSR